MLKYVKDALIIIIMIIVMSAVWIMAFVNNGDAKNTTRSQYRRLYAAFDNTKQFPIKIKRDKRLPHYTSSGE